MDNKERVKYFSDTNALDFWMEGGIGYSHFTDRGRKYIVHHPDNDYSDVRSILYLNNQEIVRSLCKFKISKNGLKLELIEVSDINEENKIEFWLSYDKSLMKYYIKRYHKINLSTNPILLLSEINGKNQFSSRMSLANSFLWAKVLNHIEEGKLDYLKIGEAMWPYFDSSDQRKHNYWAHLHLLHSFGTSIEINPLNTLVILNNISSDDDAAIKEACGYIKHIESIQGALNFFNNRFSLLNKLPTNGIEETVSICKGEVEKRIKHFLKIKNKQQPNLP